MSDDTTAPDPRPASMRRRVDFDTTPEAIPTAPVTDQPGRRYRLSLEFGAADDRQAQRLGTARTGTCAAEYNTCNPVVTPVLKDSLTAEDLRERLIARLESEPLFGAAETVDALLDELAGDPGDLPVQMQALVLQWVREIDEDRSDEASTIATAQEFTAAILSVRREHAASQAAEVERLRAELAEAKRVRNNFRTAYEARQRDYRKVADQLHASCICDPNPETTEGMLEDCPVHGADEYRPLSLRDRACKAEAERDRLRARLTGVAIHANRLKTWITDDHASITIAESILGDLLAALAAPETTPDAPTGGKDPYTLLLDELDAPTEETDG